MVAKLARITTHNTTQNTTTNMGRCRCCPTLQRLSSLSPLVWQRRPQILAPCLSHECAWGTSRRVCTHRFSSPCLGHPNATHPIIERGGVPWPWPPFNDTHNNQTLLEEEVPTSSASWSGTLTSLLNTPLRSRLQLP